MECNLRDERERASLEVVKRSEGGIERKDIQSDDDRRFGRSGLVIPIGLQAFN